MLHYVLMLFLAFFAGIFIGVIASANEEGEWNEECKKY
jgi:cbb3-type cytochrome oxidase subunit 3